MNSNLLLNVNGIYSGLRDDHQQDSLGGIFVRILEDVLDGDSEW